MKKILALTIALGVLLTNFSSFATCYQNNSNHASCYVSGNSSDWNTYYLTPGIPYTIFSSIASTGYPGGGYVEIDYGYSGMFFDSWSASYPGYMDWHYAQRNISASENDNGAVTFYVGAVDGVAQATAIW